MNTMKPIITFNQEAKDVVLDALDKAKDADGFIVEKGNPLQRVLTKDGEEVPVSKFAGVKKGSLIFFKSDFSSLIELASDL
ncbi:hypothetical protein WDW86_02145 [Bdellovibrionota bacterium FG-2]